jgi:hypothetical protein
MSAGGQLHSDSIAAAACPEQRRRQCSVQRAAAMEPEPERPHVVVVVVIYLSGGLGLGLWI